MWDRRAVKVFHMKTEAEGSTREDRLEQKIYAGGEQMYCRTGVSVRISL